MKINCISCGHKVDLGNDYDEFKGEIKCFVCRSLLEIRTQEGNIKSVKFVKMVPRPSKEEAFMATL